MMTCGEASGHQPAQFDQRRRAKDLDFKGPRGLSSRTRHCKSATGMKPEMEDGPWHDRRVRETPVIRNKTGGCFFLEVESPSKSHMCPNEVASQAPGTTPRFEEDPVGVSRIEPSIGQWGSSFTARSRRTWSVRLPHNATDATYYICGAYTSQ